MNGQLTSTGPMATLAEHSLGDVQDDWAAAEVWMRVLAARPVSPATLRTYSREIRRLRWYCETIGGPGPSSWSYQDVLAYRTFLEHQAGRYACAPGLRPGCVGWTPFRGTLSAGSIADAHRILGRLFDFWAQAGYIGRNPYAGRGGGRPLSRDNPSRRAVPGPFLQLVLTEMDAREKRTPFEYLTYYRNRFVLLLFLGTGIRAEEAVRCDMTDVGPYSDPKTAEIYWGLRLRTQKGGGPEKVAYLDEIRMDAFRRYREAFGLPADVGSKEEYGLILSPLTDSNSSSRKAAARRRRAAWRSIRTRQSAWNIVKGEFRAAARRLRECGEDAGAQLMERVSTHWLRHTLATQLMLSGAELRLVSDVMRHKDPRTTMRYTHLEFHDVARKLRDLRQQ